MEDMEKHETIDQSELWRMAGLRSKADTLIALERSQRFLWTGAAFLIALGIALFFMIPTPKPNVELLTASENGIAAFAKGRVFVIEECKIRSSFEAKEGAISLAFDGKRVALAYLNRNVVDTYGSDGTIATPLSAIKPYLVSFTNGKLSILTSQSIENEFGSKNPAPDFKIPVALLDGQILVDLDAVWVAGKNVGQTINKSKPPKAASFFDGKLRVVYDDMWLEYARDWLSFTVNRFPKWVILNKTSVVGLQGEKLAFSNGHTITIGNMSDEKELCRIDVWEGQ